MRFEYQYTQTDVKETLRWRAARKHGLARPAQGLVGWAVFVAVASLTFIWLKLQADHTVRAAPLSPAPETMLTQLVLPLVPYALILGCILIFFWKVQTQHAAVWRSNPELHQPHVVEMTEEGIRISNPLMDTLYRWPAFVAWAETPRLFLLLRSNNAKVMIPKRVVASEDELSELRRFLAAHVHEPTRGFPVIAAGERPATPSASP